MFLLHVDIKIMILYCSYLGNSGDTVLISNLKFETKSGMKYREIIHKMNLIRYSFKEIYLWES